MANPAYKPSEGKREEFRKYLEKNGVLDSLTKVLVNLYEEVDKPDDALEYIRDKLAFQAGVETLRQMQARVSGLEARIKELEAVLEQSKSGEAGPSTDGNMADDVPMEEGPSDTAAAADEPVAAADEAAAAGAAATEQPSAE